MNAKVKINPRQAGRSGVAALHAAKAGSKPATVTDRFMHEEDGIRRAVVVEKIPVEICTKCKEAFRGPEARVCTTRRFAKRSAF